jgi:hypothetical protein
MGTTSGKDHGSSKAIALGSELQSLVFDTAVTLAGAQANSVVASQLVLIAPIKIYRVVALITGAPAGTCSINVVMGTAAESGFTPMPDSDIIGANPTHPPPYAANGEQLFKVDRAITMTAAYATTVLTPGGPNVANPAPGYTATSQPGRVYDCIWGPAGSVLTLRCTANSSAAGTLRVRLGVKYVDTIPQQPGNIANHGSFNPATDIP